MEQLNAQVQSVYLAAGHRSDGKASASEKHHWLMGAATGENFWRGIEGIVNKYKSDSLGIVLHYSGYGYDASGAALWLANAIGLRPAEFQDCRIVTFFHELYATGWPWERAFWRSHRQRNATVRIACASDAVMTNREPSARWLEQVANLPVGSVPHLPVPSNIGEPEEMAAYNDRPPHAVVFGCAGAKRRILAGRGARRTVGACRRLGLVRITDIGATGHCNRDCFNEAGVDVVQTGCLPKEHVSRLLLEARVGFLDYPTAYLDKSGVLAAYLCHGLAVVRRIGRNDNKQVEASSCPTFASASSTVEAYSKSALALYEPRHSRKHSLLLLQLLNSARAQKPCRSLGLPQGIDV
jgi:hypothetical protein